MTAGTAIAHHHGLGRAGGGQAHGGQARAGPAQKQRVCRNQDPGGRRWNGWKYHTMITVTRYDCNIGYLSSDTCKTKWISLENCSVVGMIYVLQFLHPHVGGTRGPLVHNAVVPVSQVAQRGASWSPSVLPGCATERIVTWYFWTWEEKLMGFVSMNSRWYCWWKKSCTTWDV